LIGTTTFAADANYRDTAFSPVDFAKSAFYLDHWCSESYHFDLAYIPMVYFHGGFLLFAFLGLTAGRIYEINKLS